MPQLETSKVVSKFAYTIKPKPGGGFIAHSSDPSMEPIEGATEEEVQQKILAKLMTVLDKKSLVGGLLKSFLPVSVKLSSHTTAISTLDDASTLQLNPPADLTVGNSAGGAPAPIQFEKSSIFLPAILDLIALGALLYVILR